MLAQNRVIYKEGATLTDLSAGLSDVATDDSAVPMTAASGALFIGSDMPFNHRFFKVAVANAVASSVTVSLWNGSSWVSAVDVTDQTSSSGAAFGRSGIISWTPERESQWPIETTTYNKVTGLESLKIYDLYWAKITVSANLTGTTKLGYVGHRFCKDSDLTHEYPDLMRSEFMTAFASGKTDWVEQEVLAAEYLIEELRARKQIFSTNQILDWTTFRAAAVHKTAALIMNAFGPAYADRAAAADKKAAALLQAVNLDQNANARLERSERETTQGWLTR